MKAVRFLGMTLLMVLCAVNFTACDNDDEVTLDLNSLEGTWILVNSKGWEFCSEEVTKDEWDENYDFNNEQIRIIKISDNKYSFSFDYYASSNWVNYSNTTGTINDKTIDFKEPIFYVNPIIESLTLNKMILRITFDEVATGEDGHYHSGNPSWYATVHASRHHKD